MEGKECKEYAQALAVAIEKIKEATKKAAALFIVQEAEPAKFSKEGPKCEAMGRMFEIREELQTLKDTGQILGEFKRRAIQWPACLEKMKEEEQTGQILTREEIRQTATETMQKLAANFEELGEYLDTEREKATAKEARKKYGEAVELLEWLREELEERGKEAAQFLPSFGISAPIYEREQKAAARLLKYCATVKDWAGQVVEIYKKHEAKN